MAEKINCVVSISPDGKLLEIIPEEIVGNSIYSVSVTGLRDKEGNPLPDIQKTFRTPYSPLYCSPDSLRLLLDTFSIPDENLLAYIRTASRYADFIAGKAAGAAGGTPSFEVEQFVRTKVAMDVVARNIMIRASEGGGEYRLGDAEMKEATNSMAWKDILRRLEDELKKWQDAIRGYYNEGRVRPRATRIGLKSSSNTDVSQTTVDQILNDVSRTFPQWS